ncbi:hypothetical protein [Dactylosporangium sp. NPDC051541]|uniref:hypothetical protein n=1 Tax=Dactylosporangium sp. NPDC051541 TaxID=3363977 RepID=UPI0037872FA7
MSKSSAAALAIVLTVLTAGCSDDPGHQAAPASAAASRSASPSASPSPSAPKFAATDAWAAALDSALTPALKRYGTKVAMPRAGGVDTKTDLTLEPCAGNSTVPGDDVYVKGVGAREYTAYTDKDNRSVELQVVAFVDAATASGAFEKVVAATGTCPKTVGSMFPDVGYEVRVERITVAGASAVVVSRRMTLKQGVTQGVAGTSDVYLVHGATLVRVIVDVQRTVSADRTGTVRDAARSVALEAAPAFVAAIPVA